MPRVNAVRVHKPGDPAALTPAAADEPDAAVRENAPHPQLVGRLLPSLTRSARSYTVVRIRGEQAGSSEPAAEYASVSTEEAL
jgi:hypothetical protein